MESTSRESDYFVDANISFNEIGRSLRNKKKSLDPIYCPVCSITLRSNEVQTHLEYEIDKLDKISSSRQRANGKICSPSTSTVNGVAEHTKEWKTFQKVQSNRLNRLRISCKRSRENIVCPICNIEVHVEVQAHLNRCLHNMRQLENGIDPSLENVYQSDSDDNIDIEGDGEVYEWAGQERIRTTSLFQGDAANLGTVVKSTDEDEILVVDGDANTYGSQQYSEEDIIMCESNDEQEGLLKTVVESDKPVLNSSTPCVTQTSSDSNVGLVLEALKNRIRELENRLTEESFKCLICMERYTTPVISICCWHVYCEHCWLQTLGVKKLCPQCNMITSPTDLRRIYI